ncbi:MAG: T9SS type A sorting domain-containing protein [Flavobacteriales bacterium]|nr:T9SS type A sorting domain-containing protein [Flavobacteriales bacterium]
MVNDYYLQNRTFDKDRDIECEGSMVVGKNTLAAKNNYLYTRTNHDPLLSTSETKKTVPLNDVVVKSGSELLLEAKTSVTIKSGFKAESGSGLRVKIDPLNPSTRSDKNKYTCGRILRTSATNGKEQFRYSVNDDVTWTIKGYHTQLQLSGKAIEIPSHLQKGQYSLSANSVGCNIPSIVLDISNIGVEVTEFKQPVVNRPEINWKVSPNPSSTFITVESEISFTALRITDLEGRLIKKIKVRENTTELEVDVSAYSSTTYLISIEFKNGESDIKKIIVQH